MPPLCLRLEDLQHRILEVLAWTLAWSKESVQEFTNTSEYNDKEQSEVQRMGNWLVMSLQYGLQGEFQFRASLISWTKHANRNIVVYSSKPVVDHFIKNGETYGNIMKHCETSYKAAEAIAIGWWSPPTRVGVHSNYYIMQHPKNVRENAPNPKSKIRNPKSEIQNLKSKIPNLHKNNCYIRLQNPKSEIQNSRENPKFGAVGASRKGMLHTDPKSQIQTEKVWILDFGLGNFWILDSGFWIWGVLGDVPLGNSVTVPWGQRLESPLVRLWRAVRNQLYLIRLGKGRELGGGNRRKRK